MKISLSLIFFLLGLCIPLQASIIYVNTNANGSTQDGTNWQNAFLDLQDALELAEIGDEIWIAFGTYYPTTGINRSVSFELKPGIKLYGGFAGTEATIHERDWEANETILSGNIADLADSIDNSFHVIYAENLTTTTSLDGLNIQAGYADSFVSDDMHWNFGGGIYHKATNPGVTSFLEIKNCKFLNNYAKGGDDMEGGGGGIFNFAQAGNINLLIENCVFEGNEGSAAIIYNYSKNNGGSLNITWENCLLEENIGNINSNTLMFSEVDGNDISQSFHNCVFDHNTGTFQNIMSDGDFNLELKNSELKNWTGDAIEIAGKECVENVMVDSCLFYKLGGGGLELVPYIIDDYFPVKNVAVNITNSAFHENFGRIFTIEGRIDTITTLISDCLFEENGLGVDELITNYGVIDIDNSLSVKMRHELKNSNFIDNQINIWGTGVVSFSPDGSSGLMILDSCLFMGNRLLGASAAFTSSTFGFVTDTLILNNCSFIDNIFKKVKFISSESPAIRIGMSSSGSERLVMIKNSLIQDNSVIGTSFGAGAISTGHTFQDSITSLISTWHNCQFISNTGNYGGCLDIRNSTAYFTNCTFIDNKAYEDGGAVRSTHSDLQFLNCTFAENSASDYGGAIFNNSGNVSIQNSILWENYGNDGSSLDAFMFDQAPAFVVENSLLMEDSCVFDYAICNNNLYNTNPLFTDPANGDYSLQPCSPAINIGNNTFLDSLDFQTDLANQSRILSNIVDLGAYESPELEIQIDTIFSAICGTENSGALQIDSLNACYPLDIQWTSNDVSGSGLDSLSGGIYQFTITDGVGNLATLEVEIPQTLPIELAVQSTPFNCNTDLGGTISVNSFSGTPPFQYVWNNGDSASQIINLPPGEYATTVTDAMGCTASTEVTIPTIGNLNLSLEVIGISCYQANDGIGVITPLNGTPGLNGFDFLWQDGNTDSLRYDLTPGFYEVTVTDEYGCTSSIFFPLEELGLFQLEVDTIHASTPTTADGAIILENISGGTAPFSFQWSNDSTTQNISQLLSGDYILTLTDFNGCDSVFHFTVDFISSAFNGQKEDLGVQLFPNPTHSTLHLQFSESLKKQSNFNIYNALGQEAFHQELSIGQNLYSFDVTNFSSGIYFYVVEMEGRVLKEGRLVMAR